MTDAIATIGYEGASPEAFDNALRSADIEVVVDVRAIAISRRRGFSKAALSARLNEQGFRYVHLRALGDPKPGREAARAGNFFLFEKIFNAHLEGAEPQSQLDQLREIVQEFRVAVLCYEADALTCHRTIVAKRVAKCGNLRIDHLRVDSWGPASSVRARAGNYFGKGLAAA